MKVKSIYLVFSRTGTWLSRLISLFVEGKYAHASISLDDKFTQMYSFGRINPDNPFIAGFTEENLYNGVYKKFSRSECLIYKLDVTEEQYEILKEEINKFFMEKEKYKYNFLGLFGVVFNKPIRRRNHYFCTEFVSEVLMKTNIYNLDKNPALTKPDDLIAIEHKEIIYEGFINNYQSFNEVYNF
ncbi:hypothetical protein [Clostridium sp.]|uniref:hypothetical protein n=1 Tax=Clostridium sp. TaxID=1506 RepID=UPI002FC8B12A